MQAHVAPLPAAPSVTRTPRLLDVHVTSRQDFSRPGGVSRRPLFSHNDGGRKCSHVGLRDGLRQSSETAVAGPHWRSIDATSRGGQRCLFTPPAVPRTGSARPDTQGDRVPPIASKRNASPTRCTHRRGAEMNQMKKNKSKFNRTRGRSTCTRTAVRAPETVSKTQQGNRHCVTGAASGGSATTGTTRFANQDTIENSVTRFIRERFIKSRCQGPRREPASRSPRASVANTINALKSDVEVAEYVERPVWLGSGTPGEFFAFSNGLVSADAPDRGHPRLEFGTHTPEWFSNVVFDYPFEKDATCARWLALPAKSWREDVERMALLQEWFGYVLRHDVSQQQFLVLDGDGGQRKSHCISGHSSRPCSGRRTSHTCAARKVRGRPLQLCSLCHLGQARRTSAPKLARSSGLTRGR